MEFHYLARAVIYFEEKVLLVREKGANHTFLPGGHIEIGEAAKDALRREIYEEIGMDSSIGKFIGASEHVWPDDMKDNHEINLVFTATVKGLTSAQAPKSKENHIEFLWAYPEELKTLNFIPSSFRNNIKGFLNNSKFFWGSSISEE